MSTMRDRVVQRFQRVAKVKTYPQAQREWLNFFLNRGWKTDSSRRTPVAISPRGDLAIYFKPQTVLVAYGDRPSLQNAFATWTDIRKEDPERFMQHWLKRVDEELVKQDMEAETTVVKETPFGEHGFTQEQVAIIGLIMGLKPGARAEEMERYKLGPYSLRNPHISKLINKGLIKARGQAIVLDRKKAEKVLELHGRPPLYKSYFPYGY